MLLLSRVLFCSCICFDYQNSSSVVMIISYRLLRFTLLFVCAAIDLKSSRNKPKLDVIMLNLFLFNLYSLTRALPSHLSSSYWQFSLSSLLLLWLLFNVFIHWRMSIDIMNLLNHMPIFFSLLGKRESGRERCIVMEFSSSLRRHVFLVVYVVEMCIYVIWGVGGHCFRARVCVCA